MSYWKAKKDAFQGWYSKNGKTLKDVLQTVFEIVVGVGVPSVSVFIGIPMFAQSLGVSGLGLFGAFFLSTICTVGLATLLLDYRDFKKKKKVKTVG